MRIIEMQKAVKGLTAERCPFAHLHRRSQMILCPNHVLVPDEDGDLWCGTCDTGETHPQLMSCSCANLPTGEA